MDGQPSCGEGDYSNLQTFYRRCRIHKTCLLLKSQSVKTVVMTSKTIVKTMRTIVMTIKTIVMTIKTSHDHVD